LAFLAVPSFAAAADNAAAAPAAVAAAKQDDEKRQQIELVARREGYRPMLRDGERLYCKEETVTGSRVNRQRTCLTEDQIVLRINTEKAVATEILENASRGFTPRTP
jgi:hypothetical protein